MLDLQHEAARTLLGPRGSEGGLSASVRVKVRQRQAVGTRQCRGRQEAQLSICGVLGCSLSPDGLSACHALSEPRLAGRAGGHATGGGGWLVFQAARSAFRASSLAARTKYF
jgi:hypothetical protein